MSVLLALLAVGVAWSSSVAKAATMTFAPTFSPGKFLGEDSTLDAQFTFTGNEYYGSPDPVTEVFVHLPAGVGGTNSGFPTCSELTLETTGPAGCPAGSLAGPVGSIGLDIEEGSLQGGHIVTNRVHTTGTIQPVFANQAETTDNYIFYLEIPGFPVVLANGYYLEDAAPYGRELRLEFPLFESVPSQPYDSITSLTLTLGASREADGQRSSSLTIPPECPSSGLFPWATDVTYTTNTSPTEQTHEHTTAETACPGPPPDYTWTGNGSSTAWSDSANWLGGVGPTASSSIGTLSFPAMPSTQNAVNDLPGLSVNRLQMANEAAYNLSGQGLTLGSGGLDFTAAEAPSIASVVATPLTLSANQTWNLSGSSGESTDLQVSGPLSGESANLTIDLNNLRQLTLGESFSPTHVDDELGNVDINGMVVETGGVSHRTPVEIQAHLNTTDGHTLTVHNAELGVDGTGPLTVTNSSVGLDGSATGPVSFSDSSVLTEQNSYFAPSFSMEGASSLEFTIGREGTTPGTDYSQVTSSGTVALGGAELTLLDKAFVEGAGECAPPIAGRVYTLVSASTIAGTFSEIPDGGAAIADCAVFKAGAIVSEQAYAYRINYNLGSSPETVTATSLLAVPTTSEVPTTGGNNTGGGGTSNSGGNSTGTGSGSNPGNVTDTISSAQLKASLVRQLIPTGKAASSTALLKHGGYTTSFTAVEAGTLSIAWYEQPSGAKLANKTTAKPVLVAAGKLVFPAAGTGRLTVKLTAQGKRLLRHVRRVRLTAKGTFVPRSGVGVDVVEGFVG
ncbi:MAG: hypothetical protein WAN93_03380 [Solirubrobacteraceae bacterium]